MKGEKQTIPKKNNSYHWRANWRERKNNNNKTEKQYNTDSFVDSYVKKINLYLVRTGVVFFNNFNPIGTGIGK